ncbi:MAG: diguanylate cyclase [Phycisphaerales bacterium]|nr:MAG: diguanylate cyclase [Phycisphaerales bacterium]
MESAPSQPSILVVDDDRSTLDLVKRYLSDARYDVVLAENAEEGWSVLCQGGAELVITDWNMPGTSGLDLCRRIRAHRELGFFYIVMLTAQAAQDKLVEALDAGADDYVTKPFSRDELLARVRVGLRILAMHNELARRSSEFYRSSTRLADLNIQLKSQALKDGLTGLLNRREALSQFSGHWAAADVSHEPLSCVMLDIDHFKRVNDTYGHEVGDQVLVAVARLLRQTCRATDVVARFGGEEFLIVCPQTAVHHAVKIAERVRQAVKGTPILIHSTSILVTVSLGVAERGTHMRGPDDLLRAADHALYAGKHAGRDRVQVAEAETEDRARCVVDHDAGIPIE